LGKTAIKINGIHPNSTSLMMEIDNEQNEPLIDAAFLLAGFLFS